MADETIFYLVPGNDFLATVYLEAEDPTTFKATPITTGSVDGFVAQQPAGTTLDETAAAAHANLVATVVHVGQAAPVPEGEYPLGTWGVKVDGTGVTAAICDPLFGPEAAASAVLVVKRAGDVLRTQKLVYKRSLPIDVA